MRPYILWLLALALAAGTVDVTAATAQEPVDAEWAQQFIGTWNLSLETPDGDLPFAVRVAQEGGALQVELASGDEAQPIESIRRVGDNLVVSYDLEYQGMPLSAVVTIRRDGDALQTNWSFMDGLYVTDAQATRQ
jgi:uncharacterized protein